MPVINPVAVADIEARLGECRQMACWTNRGKDSREVWIERMGVDLRGNAGNDIGAVAWPVARCAIGVVGTEPGQDAGPV